MIYVNHLRTAIADFHISKDESGRHRRAIKTQRGWKVDQSNSNFKLEREQVRTMGTLWRKYIGNAALFTLILTFAFAEPLQCYAQAQAQAQAPGRTEMASLNEPAQPSPTRSASSTTTATPTGSATTTTSTSSGEPAATAESEVPAAIAKELQAMEARIEELEAALKTRDAAAPAQPPVVAATPAAAQPLQRQQ